MSPSCLAMAAGQVGNLPRYFYHTATMQGCLTRHTCKCIFAGILALVILVSTFTAFCLPMQDILLPRQENDKELSPTVVTLWGNRDIIDHNPWPEREVDDRQGPSPVLPTVHYMWCKTDEKFEFRHYLTILSAIRVIHPTKIVFHYVTMPKTDNYNTWFNQLKASVFYLELRQIPMAQCSGVHEVLPAALSLFDVQGGYFIGSEIILARPPTFEGNAKAWFASVGGQLLDIGVIDPNKVIIAVKGGLKKEQLMEMMQKSLSSGKFMECVSPEKFTVNSDCVVNDKEIFPRDIMTAPSPFAEVARWVFYGRRAPMVPVQNPNNTIPRIAHLVKLKKPAEVGKEWYGQSNLTFNHYLSILSALYVGGFHHVYYHGEEEPSGQYWKDLVTKENVSYVHLDPPCSVYQQQVNVVQHVGDLVKYLVLDKYGGAYQDLDVVWASYVPDSLLQYPAVLGVEWVKQPDFPEAVNVGVLMATPRSAWLRQFMKTHKDFRDGEWGYNPILMPYRTYELYPDTVYFDRHLQVMCFSPTNNPPIRCHPTWEENYLRPIRDVRPTLKITDWEKDVRAFHITQPKPHPSLASPEALGKALLEKKGFFYQVGYKIMDKSGRLHMIR